MTLMNTTSKLSAALLFVLAAACDDNAAKTPPTTTGAIGPAPVVEPKPVEQPTTAAAKPTQLSVLDRPASQWTIGGKSLSRVSDEEVLASAKKAGWAKDDTTMTPLVGGQYESRSFPIEKGKTKGTVKIVRPTAAPGSPDSASGFTPPSTLGAAMNSETSAYTYDADADVFVGVDLTEGGKAPEAKKILETMVVKSKTPIEGRGLVTAGSHDSTTGSAHAGTDTAAAEHGGNTKDSNAVPPAANGKANSAARNPAKDSDSIPPAPGKK